MRKRYKILGIIVLTVVICSFGLFYYVSENSLPGVTFNVGYDVYVDSNYAYISNNDGVVIYDVTKPKDTKKVGNIDIENNAFGIAVKEGIVYVAGASSGLIIADVSDPKNPVMLGEYIGGGSVINVAISGDFAYVTTPTGLEIINVSDLSNPTKVGQFNAGGRACIYVSENIAYYGGDNIGLKVLDVFNPSSPQLVYQLSDLVIIDLYVHEDLLFIASHQYGVRIYDVTTPQNIQYLGKFDEVGESWGVSGNNSHLYVADLQEGVQLLDISNPSNPQKVEEYTNAAPHDLFFDGDYVYLADQDFALKILYPNLKDLYSDSAIPGFELIPVIVVLISVLRIRKWKLHTKIGDSYEN